VAGTPLDMVFQLRKLALLNLSMIQPGRGTVCVSDNAVTIELTASAFLRSSSNKASADVIELNSA
jgi:hypothetical protein